MQNQATPSQDTDRPAHQNPRSRTSDNSVAAIPVNRPVTQIVRPVPSDQQLRDVHTDLDELVSAAPQRRTEDSRVRRALIQLRAASIQFVPSDDALIRAHVETAISILEEGS